MPDRPATEFDVLIAGGGVSALSAALRLADKNLRVAIACDADRPGGVIRSERDGDWLLEQGPNSYSSFGAPEQELLQSIGLAGRVLRRPIRTTDRYIWRGNRLHKVPTNPVALLRSPLLAPSSRARVLLALIRRYETPTADTGLGTFFRQILGDDVVDTLLKPLVGGIYAADADRISLRATFPKLGDAIMSNNRLLSAMRSIPRAPKDPNAPPKSLTSFPDGLEELPIAMARAAEQRGVTIRYGARPKLTARGDGLWCFDFDSGDSFAGRHVILATPAQTTAQLVERFAPVAAQRLRTIEHAPLMVVHVGLRLDSIRQPLDGFGFLTRRHEGVRMLGAIWSSAVFAGRAPEQHGLMTCFYGGEIDPEIMDWTDARVEEQLREDLGRAMQFIGTRLELLRIRRWKPALPVFRPGHRETIDAITSELPATVHVSSNWKGGVSIPDRIQDGWALADSLGASLAPSTSAR